MAWDDGHGLDRRPGAGRRAGGEAPGSVDVLILGATVAGITAALELARAGSSVTLLDPGEVTSFGFGLASVVQGGRLRDIELHHGLDAVTTYLDETRRAAHWLSAELDGAVRDVTAWDVAIDGHLAFHLRQESRLLRHAGVAADFTDDGPLPIMARPPLVVPGQGQVDPDVHRDLLRSHAEAAGVVIVRNAVATEFRRVDGWEVSWRRHGVPSRSHARHVLDTLGVSPWGRHAFRGRVEVCPVVAVSRLAVTDPVLFVDSPALLVLAQGGESHVIGRPVSLTRDPAASAELVSWVSGTLGAEPTRVLGRPVETTPDALPVAGEVPLLGGAWLARGFGGWETTSATAAGLQLAAAITAGSPVPWGPVRVWSAPLAAFRRWSGPSSDPMVRVPEILRRRGMNRD